MRFILESWEPRIDSMYLDRDNLCDRIMFDVYIYRKKWIADIFQVLPSKKEYSDYYKVIANHIDLKTIKVKLEKKDLF
jgi:hypothetical protein